MEFIKTKRRVPAGRLFEEGYQKTGHKKTPVNNFVYRRFLFFNNFIN